MPEAFEVMARSTILIKGAAALAEMIAEEISIRAMRGIPNFVIGGGGSLSNEALAEAVEAIKRKTNLDIAVFQFFANLWAPSFGDEVIIKIVNSRCRSMYLLLFNFFFEISKISGKRVLIRVDFNVPMKVI